MISYRSEIDGLRTIAVLSVILYHAQIVVFGHDFFKGGFVGVDIFFVISGYLISRILLSELFEKGKISFLQFYERRARRILPILFTVFLISFPLAYKYLLPNEFIEYAHSILSATFFGSNIFFYFTNTQYGAEDSLLQPFLHTWSLGVEEQFYILFPIVLLLAYKFAKNHLASIVAILVIISLAYAEWESDKKVQLNFFMLTSRLWELGIGSLLAFYELKYGRVKHELLNQTMPLIGLAMIGHAIVFFNNQTPHPSFITLLPTLGTALIILYSVNKTDLVGKVLSWKPIVGVGLISYSMYLWHYPLFAFVRLADSNVSNDEKYLLILLTIALSIVSYFLIEKPFRNKLFIKIRILKLIIIILTILTLILNFWIIDTNGLKNRLHIIKYDITHPQKLLKKNKKNCHDRNIDFCFFEANSSLKKNKTIALSGDSHMGTLSSFLKDQFVQYGYNFKNLSSIPYLPNTRQFGKNGEIDSYDLNFQKRLKEEIQNSDIIIFGGWYQGYTTGKYFHKEQTDLFFGFSPFKDKNNKPINFKKHHSDTIKELANKNKTIILIYPIPEVGFNVIRWYRQDKSELKVKYDIFIKRAEESYKMLDSIKGKKVYRFYPEDVLCANKKDCLTILNNHLLYYDDNHLSTYGAKIISKNIIEKLKKEHFFSNEK